MIFWNIVIGIASFILNLVLMPKPQNAKASSLDDVDAPVAEEGWEIPVVFGTPTLRGPNVVWYGDFDADAIKGKRRYGFFGPRQIIGYQYQIGMHLVLCHGVADFIRSIWVGDKEAWAPVNAQEALELPVSIYIDKPNLFGGKDKEGGIWGQVDLLSGSPAQGQNDYLVAKLGAGADTPAFRGVVSVVLRRGGSDMSGMHIGTTTYVKPWDFTLTRMHKTSQGATQWYDSKVAVPETPGGGLANEPGLTLNRPGGTDHDMFSRNITTNNNWAALSTTSIPTADGSTTNGFRTYVWDVRDGSGRYFDSTGNVGIGGYCYITKGGLLITRGGGNIWGTGDTTLYWRDLSTSNMNVVKTQAVSPYYSGPELNSGLQACEITIGGTTYMYMQIYPYIAFTGPIMLFENNNLVASAQPNTDIITGWGYSTMGTVYAYAESGSAGTHVSRVKWVDHSFESAKINPTGISGDLHDTIGAIDYNQATDEVVITLVNGRILVYTPDLMTLKRSGKPAGMTGSGINQQRNLTDNIIVDANTVMMVDGSQYAPSHVVDWFHFVNLNTFEIERTITVDSSSYVHREDSALYMAFNDLHGGVFIKRSGGNISYTLYWPVIPAEGLDMNPSHIIRECLTDPLWGMGYTSADIDDVSFQAAADALWDECFGLTLVWAKEERIEDFVSMVLSHIDAFLYLKRSTGKFVLKLVRNDYDINTIPIINEDDVIMWDNIEHRQPAESINSVIVKYTDRGSRGKDASHSFDNTAQIAQLGERISTTRFYPGIMRGGLAVRVAQRDQRSLGIGIITGRIVTKRTEMEELYPGDPFRLVSNRHHLEGQVFRVMDMRLGDGRSNQLQVRIAQDVFNLNPNELVDTGSSLWRPPDATPLPVTQRFVWEMPFREMVQLMGPADSDALLAAKPTAGLLQATGRKPNPGATDIVIYVDGVEEDSAFFSPFGITTTDLAPLEDEIVVSGGVDLDDIVLGSLAVIADSSNETTEIIRIDLVTDSTLAVSRGMLDTVPQAHLTGKYIFAFDDTAMTDYNNRVAGTSVTVQLATRTPAGVLDVASAPSDTLLYDGRAIRPFRPANVQIEGYVEGPVDAQGLIDINVTWANRNRRTEVEVPLEWDDDDVTPEVGQTTIIEVYEEDGTTLLTTHADLPGTSFDVPITSFDGQPIGVVKIGAERDGYREWQAYSFIVFVSADNLILDSDDLVLDDETLYIGE